MDDPELPLEQIKYNYAVGLMKALSVLFGVTLVANLVWAFASPRGSLVMAVGTVFFSLMAHGYRADAEQQPE